MLQDDGRFVVLGGRLHPCMVCAAYGCTGFPFSSENRLTDVNGFGEVFTNVMTMLSALTFVNRSLTLVEDD